jgi:hypothetical protein
MTAQVPEWAARDAAAQVRNLGIPPRPSSVVLAAIGNLLGLTGEALRAFATPRPGRKKPAANAGEFMASLERELL